MRYHCLSVGSRRFVPPANTLLRTPWPHSVRAQKAHKVVGSEALRLQAGTLERFQAGAARAVSEALKLKAGTVERF